MNKTLQPYNNRYRKKTFFTDSIKHHKTYSCPVRALITITFLPGLLPVLLLFGCSSHTYLDNSASLRETEVGTTVTLRSPASEIIHNMDIFTFEDNELMRLDSYQRVDETDSNEIEVRSQSGKKIIFVCGNCRRDKYDWAEINSIGSLSGITVRLAEEDREKTFMTGYGKAEAGKPEMCIIALRPLLSEIRLRSIRCDFSGKSYEGESIRNPKVYLINVNAQCSITDDGDILPTHIINTGGLMTDDLEKFHDPGIIYQEIDTDIGKEGLKNGISLFCYPNTSLTEGPGTPFTKLVIEGEIEGKTYWWPIEINRGEDISKPGIWRNSSYIYDIVIRRKGADSPDSSFEIGSMDLKMEAASWKEKEEYSVGF